MLKRFSRIVSQFWQITRTPIVTQLLAIVIELVFLGFLFYLWQTEILTAEQGLYSPFQSGLSLIRFLGLIVMINICFSFAAIKRDMLWIWLPLVSNMFLIGLTLHYLTTLIRQ